MKKVVAIICGKNPNAKSIQSEIKNHFALDFDLKCVITQKGTTQSIAANAAAEGVDIILSVGGDGTTNEIINGIIMENVDISKLPSLVVIPFGTGNDLARTINAGKNYDLIIDKIKKDDFTIIDVAKITYQSYNNLTESRYFINTADIGFGPMVITKVEKQNIKWPGKIAYILAATSIFTFQNDINITLEADEYKYEGPIYEVCITNGKYFGGGFGVSPYAIVDDEVLDLVVVKKFSMFNFLEQFKKLRKGQPIMADQVTYRKITQCSIISNKSKQIPFEIDGELLGTTPIDIKIVPSSVKIFVNTK
ncbi:MAG: diacylglycerol kinase family lipid kinase [Bacteroidales bacterium]|nr:diacylglycerol kinase family lipid kinase [Bacteroidales bacterium]